VKVVTVRDWVGYTQTDESTVTRTMAKHVGYLVWSAYVLQKARNLGGRWFCLTGVYSGWLR